MAYQIPYNQPRIYTNLAQWINRNGISQENNIIYHEAGIENNYANTDFNLHPSSNQSLSGVWELEPHNYYVFNPSQEVDGSPKNLWFSQFYAKQVEGDNGLYYPHYNVRLSNLRNLFDSLLTGNGYIALLGSNLYQKNLMFKFCVRFYERNEENTDFDRNSNGTLKIKEFTFTTEPLYNCDANAFGHYTMPSSNGSCMAKIKGATLSVNDKYIQGITVKLVDKNYVWENPETETLEGVASNALNNGDYEDIKVGSIAFGTYWDFPVNSDLNLKFNRSFGGVKTSRSLGGFDTTNINHTGAPTWATGSAWSDEMNPETDQGGISIANIVNKTDFEAFKRTGRRSWNLNFKGLRDYQIMNENEVPRNNHHYASATNNGTNYNTDNNEINSDAINVKWNFGLHSGGADDFFSNVLNKTYGAEKFIFQPDKEDFSSLALAKFNQKSFSFTQSSHKFFDIALNIEEVW